LEDYLYLQIMKYRRIPRDLFTGSPAALQAMQAALDEAPGAQR
jgi:hypothetical protein